MTQLVSWQRKFFYNVQKRPFGYEEETIFPWNAKISHS
jgi:hypothetical protein